MEIEKDIFILNSFFDKKIKKNIFEKVKEKYLGYCDKEYGYITDISDGLKIIGNKTSPDNNGAIFTIRFTCDTLKPEIGKIYEGIVCLILSNGIFIIVKERLKILIPDDKLGDYKYSDGVFKKGKKKIISKGNSIQVEIVTFKYDNGEFQCIGKLG